LSGLRKDINACSKQKIGPATSILFTLLPKTWCGHCARIIK
jgi:hypothetical protein